MDWLPFNAFFDELKRSTEPKQLLERLLQGLVKMVGASRGVVLLREAGPDELTPVAFHKVEDRSEFLKISSTVYKRALATSQTVFVSAADDPDWLAGATESSLAMMPRAILCGPLLAQRAAGAEAFGAIYLDGFMGRTKIEESQIPLFETITGLAGELLAATKTRNELLAAQHCLQAYDRLWEGEGLVLGDGEAGQEIAKSIEAAAPKDVTVLITGETGTGKEMVARALHKASPRRMKPFVPVNCAALSRGTLEAELFGAEKGAYTGANELRLGRFEMATGGTLFLDEVGEIETDVQVKLLRVLQERKVTRLGGSRAIPLDFRLICATNRNLEEEMNLGNFRDDLFYRINVFQIHLPPLRERLGALVPLAEHFLATFMARFNKELGGFTEEAIAVIRRHSWPGNVRELRNAIERAVVIEQEDDVTAASLPVGAMRKAPMGGSASPFERFFQLIDLMEEPFDDIKELFERSYLENRWERYEGNVSKMIRETGIPRNTLYRRLQHYGILKRD